MALFKCTIRSIENIGLTLNRTFHSNSINLARHSNKRLGRAVCEAPIKPAPKSEFFNSLPSIKKMTPKELNEVNKNNNTFDIENMKVAELKLQNNITQEEVEFLNETVPEVFENEGAYKAFQADTYKSQAKLVLQANSLDTANSHGILAYNKQRCIEKFGKNQADTGSPEVQAAIWTLRIRNLERHMVANHKDVANQRALTKLYHKRAKILKYLKQQNLERYFVCLKTLGVTQEMVEGEISIRQKHN
ncbi:S15/NS1 RNA-binding domain-containing protein [Neoconidiobolus thromboides FSU 785]|nr:S15/NS1 RNA-binding domain-containing protein [Neoconidiobolus thromboides FSU 785]